MLAVEMMISSCMGFDPPAKHQSMFARLFRKGGRTNQACVATLGDNCQALLVAVGHDLAELLGRLGLDDDRAIPMVLAHPVIVVRVQLVGLGRVV